MKVYVVTGLDLGWDCVVGVYDHETIDYNDLEEMFPLSDYTITEKTIEVILN